MLARGAKKIFQNGPSPISTYPIRLGDLLSRIEKIAAFGEGVKSKVSKSKKGGGGPKAPTRRPPLWRLKHRRRHGFYCCSFYRAPLDQFGIAASRAPREA